MFSLMKPNRRRVKRPQRDIEREKLDLGRMRLENEERHSARWFLVAMTFGTAAVLGAAAHFVHSLDRLLGA
jgi:hypothetical protein